MNGRPARRRMLRVSPAHIACVSLILHDIVACAIDATSYGRERRKSFGSWFSPRNPRGGHDNSFRGQPLIPLSTPHMLATHRGSPLQIMCNHFISRK